MHRLGFPLLVSSCLVLGMWLAPARERMVAPPEADRPAELARPVLRPRTGETDVVALLAEGFLVDAQGTERDVITRVQLRPDEPARDLPWRLRAELRRSEQLFGWAGRVRVEAERVDWTAAPLGARWRDAGGRVVVLGVSPRTEVEGVKGEREVGSVERDTSTEAEPGDPAVASDARLVERYVTAIDVLRPLARPVVAESLGPAAPGEVVGVEDAAAERPSTDWLAATAPREADAAPAAATVWVDREGIVHRLRLPGGARGQALLDELQARFPPRSTER